MVVGAILARNQGPQAIALSSLGFGAFSYAIELYMHHESEPDD